MSIEYIMMFLKKCSRLFVVSFMGQLCLSADIDTLCFNLEKAGFSTKILIKEKTPFAYNALFGAVMSEDLDDKKLEENIVNLIQIGLFLYRENSNFEWSIENSIKYLQSLPKKYEEYGFKGSLSLEEIKSLESQFHSISESHSSTTSSEKSSGSTSPKL